MCRLMGFIGSQPMLLADVVLWPDRSLIKQSYDARERKGDPNLPFHLQIGALNGDGFGIGWFSADERREKDPTPCVFTAITPAWNNENLARLACKIVSPLIFAHVRAAYPGMPVSEQNCHPFMYGRYMWMHNGVVAGFSQIKRALLGLLSDVAYNSIQSFHSDSAVSFALFLHHLPNPYTQQAPEVLLKAMQDTIHTIGHLQRAAGVTATSLLNYVMSDGACMLATRFVMPETADAASLYYAEGAAFTRTETVGKAEAGAACCAAAPGGSTASSSILHEASYDLVYGERGAQVAFVASEPITGSAADWVSVPKNMALIITREKGGYINILRTQLTVPAANVAPETGLITATAGNGINGLVGVHGASVPPWAMPSSQAEVAVCLEAISRGLAAKSRPWVVPATQALRQQQLSHLVSGLETGASALERVSEAANSTSLAVSTAVPSANGSRVESMSGNEYLPTATVGVNGMHGPSGASPAPTVTPEPRAEHPLDALMLGHDDGTPHFQRLVGHTGPILCMIMHEDSGRLYTASVDCTIRTWSLADNSCLGSVTAGKKPVTCMQLRGQWLYSGAGRKMRVWDTTRGCVCVDVVRIANHCGNIRCLLPMPGRVFLGCQDASVKAFLVDEDHWRCAAQDQDAPAGRISRRMSIDTAPARDPEFVTSSQHGHVGAVNALVASTSGQLIISASGDAMIRVWRADTLAHVRTLRGHRGSVLSLLVIENLLISGARDNTIRVWDLDLDLMCRCTLTGHKDDVTHLSAVTLKKSYSEAQAAGGLASRPVVLPCTVVASASADGTVRLWSLTWTCLAVLAIPTNPSAALHPSADPESPGPHPPRHPLRLSTRHSHPAHPPARVPGASPAGLMAAPGRYWDQQVPAVLCAAMTGSLVCGGYSDGEIRLWPCAGVHLLALRLVASDLGLLPQEAGRASEFSGGQLSAHHVPSPFLLSPSLLSPAHPLLALAAAWAHNGATDSTNAPQSAPSQARGVDVPRSGQTLGQGNIRDVLSALSVCQAQAAAGTMLASAVSTTTHARTSLDMIRNSNGGVTSMPEVPLSPGASSVVSTTTTTTAPVVTRSSGSYQLDSHMRKSLGGMMMAGGMLGAAVADMQGGSPTFMGSPHAPMASHDGSFSPRTHGMWQPQRPGSMPSVPASDPPQQQQQQVGDSLATPRLGSTGTSGGGSSTSPSLLTQLLVRDGSKQQPHQQQQQQGAGTSPGQASDSSSVGMNGARHSEGLAGRGVFGSLVHTDHMDHMGRSQRTSISTVHGTQHLDTCDERGEDSPSLFGAVLSLEEDDNTQQQQQQQGDEEQQGEGEQQHTLRVQTPMQSNGLQQQDGGHLQLQVVGRRGSGASITCGGAVGAATHDLSLSRRESMHSANGSARDDDAYMRRTELAMQSELLQLLGRPLSALSQAPGVEMGFPPHMHSLLHSSLEMNRPLGMLSGVGSNSTDMMMESCLRDFVRIPTVSSNPRMREECVKGAKYLAKLLESLGADVKVVRPYEDKNPIVIGRLGHDPAKATICFYGHYDVQPAQEAEWATNPFELAAVNEHLYGRGTSDNKGPILAFIFAVKELMDDVEADEHGVRSLPVNIVFIFEGEEENGSIGFREAVTQNLRWFEGTQLVVISNTNWVGESVPCITYGMRGMMSVSVSVSGPQRDVHSGNDGGVFVEPMMDLIATMATVMHAGGTQIKIPGFGDQVAPGLMDLAWASLQQHGQGEFSREGYQASLGVPALTPPPGARNLLEARWCRPSLSVVDMRPHTAAQTATAAEKSACYRFGPTRFSVIPATAVAKISVRFVARQDPKHIITCLRNHVHAEFAKLRSPNTVHVHVDALGNWWEADVSSKWIQMAEAAVRREWGCEPLYVREGGTMPVASVLERLLSAPAIMIPMGQSSDSPHLANERIRRTNLIKGKGVIRALLEEVAGFWQPGAPSRDLAAAAARCSSGPPWDCNQEAAPLPGAGQGCGAVREGE